MRFIFVITLCASAAAFAQDGPLCTAERADSATTLAQLRELKSLCDIRTDAYARAWQRINSFPLPENLPTLSMQTELKGAKEFRVTYEGDVFFNWLEAYPLDVAFTKLADLVQKVSTGYYVEQVQVIASADPTELSLASLKIDVQRAEFLRRYLLAVGFDAGRISVSTRPPTHENTTMGRAYDRSALVRVVMRRQPTERLQ
jgi:hypothetical protein